MNVGFCASHLLSAVGERASTVFPAGIASDGILMAALMGLRVEPGLNLQNMGKEARYYHALHTSPEMSKTADEAFLRPRNAAKFGCDMRATASLKQANHFIEKFVILQTIIQDGLCIHSSLEGISYFLKFTHHNFLAVYPIYNIYGVTPWSYGAS